MKASIGFAMCGSFCTFNRAFDEMKKLVESGYNVIPVMSETAYGTDTRFGEASGFVDKAEKLTGKRVIHTISRAEPIGPKGMCDLLIVAPCTGNTLAKLSCGITDTAVTMAVKSHLRIKRPVLLCPATNDGLAASAQNIGRLMNTKNIFFVPMSQDDPKTKPSSLVARFDMIEECAEKALARVQVQPVVI